MNLIASGTQLAVINTEHILSGAALSPSGIYVFKVDKNAMQAGDTLELRIYNKVLISGTSRVAYFASFSGVQSTDDQIAISVPTPSDIEFKATLKQTVGTGRSYPWSILTL